MISIGLDVSCTAMGIIALQDNGDLPHLLWQKVFKPNTKGLQRASDIAEQVIHVVEGYKPQRIVIEGYGGAFKGSLIPLVEVGTVVRYFVRQLGHSWLEPAPSQLKQFALGKGAGEKEQIMMQVFKKWGYEAPDNNAADAYVLACMGLGHAGKLTGMNQKMREVLGTLKLQ